MVTQILRGSSGVTLWKFRPREGSVKPTATRLRGGRFRGDFECRSALDIECAGIKGPEHRLTDSPQLDSTSLGLDFDKIDSR